MPQPAPRTTSPAVEHVVVFAGGDPPLPDALAGVPTAQRVIAADSGMDHALTLGASVDVLVGDLDSVSAEGRRQAEATGVHVIEHPAAKDATDLELALALALAEGPRMVTVVGGHGGRLDHLLANVSLLASPLLAGVEVRALLGPALVTVIRSAAALRGRPGELVSLLPVHGPALGVRTEGLRYPLRTEDLPVGSSRGVSNELLGPDATITIRSGTLVAVQPEAFA
jgi:thiamine pyrophosphokinase